MIAVSGQSCSRRNAGRMLLPWMYMAKQTQRISLEEGDLLERGDSENHRIPVFAWRRTLLAWMIGGCNIHNVGTVVCEVERKLAEGAKADAAAAGWSWLTRRNSAICVCFGAVLHFSMHSLWAKDCCSKATFQLGCNGNRCNYCNTVITVITVKKKASFTTPQCSWHHQQDSSWSRNPWKARAPKI